METEVKPTPPPAAGFSNQVQVQPQNLTSDLPQVCCLPPGRGSAGGTAVTDILLPPGGNEVGKLPGAITCF